MSYAITSTSFGVSQRLVQASTVKSDVNGNANFNFPPPPMGSVWTGTINVPNAPNSAQFQASVLGTIWAVWNGPFPGGTIQAFNGETLTVTAKGLQAFAVYNALWQGISQPEDSVTPTMPTVVTQPGQGIGGGIAFIGKFAVSIGDGSTTTFTIAHNLNSTDLMSVLIYDDNINLVEGISITIVDQNNIRLVFPVAPTTSQYRVIVAA